MLPQGGRQKLGLIIISNTAGGQNTAQAYTFEYIQLGVHWNLNYVFSTVKCIGNGGGKTSTSTTTFHLLCINCKVLMGTTKHTEMPQTTRTQSKYSAKNTVAEYIYQALICYREYSRTQECNDHAKIQIDTQVVTFVLAKVPVMGKPDHNQDCQICLLSSLLLSFQINTFMYFRALMVWESSTSQQVVVEPSKSSGNWISNRRGATLKDVVQHELQLHYFLLDLKNSITLNSILLSVLVASPLPSWMRGQGS